MSHADKRVPLTCNSRVSNWWGLYNGLTNSSSWPNLL